MVWPALSREALSGAILLACQCGWELVRSLNDYVVEGGMLRLHIGIGAGEAAGKEIN